MPTQAAKPPSPFGLSKDVGMVSSTGNGRRYAAQALLRSIAQSEDFELTAVLVYDTGLVHADVALGAAIPEGVRPFLVRKHEIPTIGQDISPQMHWPLSIVHGILAKDWKNETGHWALPSEGPQHVTLNIRGGQPV